MELTTTESASTLLKASTTSALTTACAPEIAGRLSVGVLAPKMAFRLNSGSSSVIAETTARKSSEDKSVGPSVAGASVVVAVVVVVIVVATVVTTTGKFVTSWTWRFF